jgi:hypothetical protein
VKRILLLVLALVLAGAASAESWQGVERVVAVGDVHGSFDQFTTVLRQAGVIDEKNRWSGGKTHLVQLGDVPDRAPDTRKVLDLLMDLEKQAKKAGGMVHALIGNHEAMNMYGDLRYATPEEFASFRTSRSEEIREHFWQQHLEEQKAQGKTGQATAEEKKAWEAERPLGFFEHRFEFGSNGKYGKWIRDHHAMIRINDTLFLHGGISPKYASLPLKELNKQIRKELSDFKHIPGGVAADPEGPLWYRGLAVAPEGEIASHLDALLTFHGAKRIVIGHTPTKGLPVARFGGKVILADVGLGVAYGGRLACVILENGESLALSNGQKQPIAAGAPIQAAAVAP